MIKTNYSKKIIDSSRYSVVDINNSAISEEEMKENGCVFLPYIMVEHTEESLKEYDEFMNEYHKQHQCCPKCGSIAHTTTLVGYILNWGKKKDYKDMNRCEGMKCGDKHTAHDRVPFTGIRTRGKGLKKEIWFSICSAHMEYDENCPRCTTGTWNNVIKYKISSLIYDICPSLWRWWVNRF